LVSTSFIQILRSRATAILRSFSSSGSRRCSRSASAPRSRNCEMCWRSSRALARLIDHLLAVGDLGRRVEVAIEQLVLACPRSRAIAPRAREVADHRLVLPHLALAAAGDVARRHVAQPRPGLARGVEDILGAHRVDPQRALERRRERHQAGAVDDRVQTAGAVEVGELLVGEVAQRPADAPGTATIRPHEGRTAPRTSRSGRTPPDRDLLVEPLVGGVACAGPNEAVDTAYVGIAVQQSTALPCRRSRSS
jgi:hypothetical protein